MSVRSHLTAAELNELLQLVAERRAEGKDWETVAAELQRPASEICTLIFEQEALFGPLLKKARRERKQLCYDAALESLREQAKSDNEEISHSAANLLAQLEIERKRTKKAKKKLRESTTVETPPESELVPHNTYSILHHNPTLEEMLQRCLSDDR